MLKNRKYIFSFLAIGLFMYVIHCIEQRDEHRKLRKQQSTEKGTEGLGNTDYSIDQSTGLIKAPGFELILKNCTKCHTPKLITQNRANRSGWTSTIRWMQEKQGLWDLGADESIILDYLSKHYAPKAGGRRKALADVEWYHLDSSTIPKKKKEPSLNELNNKQLYEKFCVVCHGEQGDKKLNGASNLQFISLSATEIHSQVKLGSSDGRMPGFEHTLTNEQIDQIVLYVQSLNKL